MGRSTRDGHVHLRVRATPHSRQRRFADPVFVRAFGSHRPGGWNRALLVRRKNRFHQRKRPGTASLRQARTLRTVHHAFRRALLDDDSRRGRSRIRHSIGRWNALGTHPTLALGRRRTVDDVDHATALDSPQPGIVPRIHAQGRTQRQRHALAVAAVHRPGRSNNKTLDSRQRKGRFFPSSATE